MCLKTALHIACSNSNVEISKVLLKKKANVNDKDNLGIEKRIRISKCNAGWTPLHCACSPKGQFSIELVTALLKESGIDVVATTVEGITPLHFVMRYVPSSDQEAAYLEVIKRTNHLIIKVTEAFL